MIPPVLASLHWLPVHFHMKVLVFVLKASKGLTWPYLTELLHPHTPSHSVLRSSDQLLLRVPKTKRKLRGGHDFSVVAPKMWNNQTGVLPV